MRWCLLSTVCLSLLLGTLSCSNSNKDVVANPAASKRVTPLLKEWEGCYLDNIADCKTLYAHYDSEAEKHPKEAGLVVLREDRLLDVLEVRIEELEDQARDLEFEERLPWGPRVPRPADTPQALDEEDLKLQAFRIVGRLQAALIDEEDDEFDEEDDEDELDEEVTPHSRDSLSTPVRTPGKKVDWSKMIRKTGPWRYRIDRAMFEKELEDLTPFVSGARIIPNYRGGKYLGFRLAGVRPDSFYQTIGLQSGDIIRRVNGVNIDSPSKAISLFKKLDTESRVVINIQRDGAPRTLTLFLE